ncbi:cadherin-like domain-containing protein [Vibrio parahaemolyticus]|nr:cadherin-like domain-containing protein [Vibrio parahaemolyticus]
MFNTHFNIVTSNTFKLSTTALIGLLSLTFNATAQSQDIPHGHVIQQEKLVSPTAKGKRQQAQDNTSALKQAMADYRGASAKNKHHYLEQMISLAHGRQALLSELFQSDPSAVAQVALTAKARKGMPEKVQALLEQEQTLEGELEVFYEHYEDHSKSRLRHVLNTSEGFIEVHGSSQSPINAIQSGAKVRARGWKFDNQSALVLEESQQSLLVLADGSTGSASTSTSSFTLSNTLGEQSTLVMLVNFQDDIQEPWTVEEVTDLVFGSVNDFYKENSNNQTWFAGDVLGYYTLPINSVCDTAQIYTASKDVAATKNVDIDSYSRVVFVFPKIADCGWTGKGTVGGTPSRTWVNGSLTLRTVAHELGHNLGLHHAKKLECGVDVISGDCYTIEYGDSLEIMGTPGFTGHFNAFNKDSLGWFSAESSSVAGKIIEVSSDGSYILEPYELAPESEAKAIKVQRGVDSTGKKLWYYLEYRQPTGFDSYLESYPSLTSGVTMRLGTESDMNSSQIIDLTPASQVMDWNDSTLAVGSTYTDADAGITMTTEWADNTGASVHISFTQPVCNKSDPVVTVSPSQNVEAESGTTLGYNVTVTNNDAAGCDASEFEVDALVPSGWTATSSTLNLDPGASESVLIDVTSDVAATDGNYSILFNVTNSADTNYFTKATENYVIETPVEACLRGTPLLVLSASQTDELEAGSTASYTATLTNQDSATCDASTFTLAASVPSGWSANSGAITLNPSETQSLTMNITSSTEATEGTYDIAITAQHLSDSSLSVSKRVSFSISAPVPVPVNTAPTAQTDRVEVTSKDSVSINVLANDSDPEGDRLTITSVTQGSKGSVQITLNGQLIYTPAKSFKGSDSFSYTISDGYLTSTASVYISMASSSGNDSSKGKGRK